MRLVMVMLLAALVALPLSASAQDAEEGTEPTVEEPAPEPALEEPALRLELDDAGIQVASPSPRTPEGYTLEELELANGEQRLGSSRLLP